MRERERESENIKSDKLRGEKQKEIFYEKKTLNKLIIMLLLTFSLYIWSGLKVFVVLLK
jgi:hypothetical protein